MTIVGLASDAYYDKLTVQKFVTKTIFILLPGKYGYKKLFGGGMDNAIFDMGTMASDRWFDYMNELNENR